MADPTKRQTGAQNLHVSDHTSHEDESMSPAGTEDSLNPFVRWTLVDSEFNQLLGQILPSESGATVMSIDDDEASSRVDQRDLYADASQAQPSNVAGGYAPFSELESSYHQVLSRLRKLRDSFSHEEQKTRIDDVSIQLRIWGNEIWDKPGYSNMLTQDYLQEADAMNMMIDFMNKSIDVMQASPEDKEFETLLDSLHSCVDDLCDVSESLSMIKKIQAKTDPVTQLKAHLSTHKTSPANKPILLDNSKSAGQARTPSPLLQRTSVDRDWKPDQDDILAGSDVYASASSQGHIHKRYRLHLDAIDRRHLPSINIDSEHVPAHTRSNSPSSATSSISDRGETLYERYHPNGSFSFIQPPESGKSGDLQIALYAQLVSMEGGKHDLYKRFFPKGSLDQLITPQIVYESISESTEKGKIRDMNPEEIRQYAEKVCGSSGSNSSTKRFKKMFAVLLLADAPGLIIDFVDEDLNDSDLPLILDPQSNHRSIQRHLYRKTKPDEPIQCLESWSIPGRTSFYSYQWTTIAPFFASPERTRGIKIYKLSKEDILPWTKRYEFRAYGGYSEVYRVAIHENHHDFGDRKDSDGTFAVKKLRYEEAYSTQTRTFAAPSQPRSKHVTKTFEERARQQFRDEVEVLERFSNDNHPHLISLLAAFQKGQSCYLLFDWADSDLLNLWKHTTPGPPLEEQNVKWLINQMYGISDGLYRIHTYRLSNNGAVDSTSGFIYGRHGDIKPQNFLIFKKENQSFQESVIKLTDFGLSSFHSETSRSGIQKSKIAGFTPSYRPPELDLEGATISRSIDIWSLGCVFLEFITWHFGGWSYLHDFVIKRMGKDIISGHKTDQFFEFVKNGETEDYEVRIKPAVLEWISEIHMREDCSNLMHDVLDFVEKRMLAMIPPSKNTNLPNTRARIEEVVDNFRSFRQRVSEDDYSLTGRSKRTNIDNGAVSVEKPLETLKNLGKGVQSMKSLDASSLLNLNSTRRWGTQRRAHGLVNLVISALHSTHQYHVP